MNEDIKFQASKAATNAELAEFNWLAQDSDGEIYAYVDKPTLKRENGEWVGGEVGEVMLLDQYPTPDDWIQAIHPILRVGDNLNFNIEHIPYIDTELLEWTVRQLWNSSVVDQLVVGYAQCLPHIFTQEVYVKFAESAILELTIRKDWTAESADMLADMVGMAEGFNHRRSAFKALRHPNTEVAVKMRQALVRSFT